MPTPRDVFVQIASYQDSKIVQTLSNLSQSANLRVRFGVVITDDDDDRVAQVEQYADVIRVRTDQPRGDVFDRSIAQAMWEGEPWYVGIDAHMIASQGWDERLVASISAVDNAKTVVTAIPPLQLPFEMCNLQVVLDLDAEWGFGGTRIDAIETGGAPLPASIICGSMFIAPSRFIQDVPIDPFLDHRAEETAQTLRAYTHGYDILNLGYGVLAQVEDTLRHTNRPEGIDGFIRRKGWASRHQPMNETVRDVMAVERAAVLFGLKDGDLGAYGLGAVRSRDEFWRYCGVEFSYDTLTCYRGERLRPEIKVER